MECNRDEALRSREIAEQKFLQQDLLGAKRSALKAQCLFPELDGLHQLLAVLEVHLTAQEKVSNGMELNWYGILQTDVGADHATIRKQYRKLALVLHPDKNKAVGAGSAFKLISSAWRVLSDKNKRAEHDTKRSVTGSINPSSGAAATNAPTGFTNFWHFTTSCHAKTRSNSFWTVCPFCKIQFEYFSSQNSFCPSCGKVSTAENLTRQTSAGFAKENFDFLGKRRFLKDDKSGATCPKFGFHWAGVAAKYKSSTWSTAEMVHEAYEMVKKQRLKAQKEARDKLMKGKMEEEKTRKEEENNIKEDMKVNELERQAKIALHTRKSLDKLFGRAATSSCECLDNVSDFSSHDFDGHRQEHKVSLQEHKPPNDGVSVKVLKKCDQYILSSKRMRIDS